MTERGRDRIEARLRERVEGMRRPIRSRRAGLHQADAAPAARDEPLAAPAAPAAPRVSEPPRPRGYGRCVWCSSIISAARLRAVPGAVRCLACQHAEEGRPALG